MSSYGTKLQDRILQVGQRYDKYMEIMHKLQQSIGTCTGIGASTSTSYWDADCHLTTNGLVRFRDIIYVPN